MSLRSIIVGQFKRPHGFLGRLAGYIMARRASNVARNTWTVGLLELQQHHHVLEIGCGPGIALKACAEIVRHGRIVGIDHSETMIENATGRLRQEIGEDLVSLQLGGLDLLERYPEEFDRVFSANVVQFFPDIDDAFVCIAGCLKPGGIVATTFQPRSSKPTRQEALDMALDIQSAMISAGLRDVETCELPLTPAPAICVLGRVCHHPKT